MKPRIVLLIDGHTDGREALATLLRATGLVVVTAANGTEGMHFLKLGLRPCAILLDLIVPGDGMLFRVEQINDPELAAIPVIGGATIARTQDHIEPPYRVAHLLMKPFDLDHVLGLLNDLCGAARDQSAA